MGKKGRLEGWRRKSSVWQLYTTLLFYKKKNKAFLHTTLFYNQDALQNYFSKQERHFVNITSTLDYVFYFTWYSHINNEWNWSQEENVSKSGRILDSEHHMLGVFQHKPCNYISTLNSLLAENQTHTHTEGQFNRWLSKWAVCAGCKRGKDVRRSPCNMRRHSKSRIYWNLWLYRFSSLE